MGEVGPDVVLHPGAYVHPSAHIYGRVTIGEGASVWINTAIRAERHEIRVGAYSNTEYSLRFLPIYAGVERSLLAVATGGSGRGSGSFC